VRLGDIAQTTSGGTPRRDKPHYYGGTIPWVKSGELGDRVVYETSEFLTDEGLASSNAKLFPKGTLCIALYGATVGKLGILGIDAATNQAVCAVFPPENLDTRFLYHFFEGKRRELIEQGKGGAQSNISQGIIRDTLLPIPPLPEQRQIVAEIEKQFTRLEAGVTALRRVQANLKRYSAAVLKAACEGRLVPTEAELAISGNQKATFETGEALLARILTERRQNWQGRGKHKEPVAPETAGLPPLPEGWMWATFDQGCDAVSDERKKIAKGDYLPEGEFPVIDQGESFIGGFSNDKSLVFAGDLPVILFGDHTRRFKLASDRFIVGADGVKLIGLTPAWNAKFLWYQFQQLDFEDRGYSRHFQFVRKAPLRLPPLVEQTRIVAEIERRLSVVEELEAVVSANLRRATRLRQSILHKAFTGSS